jgi:hypothetical protein
VQTPFAVTSRDKFTATVGFLVVGFAEVVRLLRADTSEADMDVPGRCIAGFEFRVTAVGRVSRVSGSSVN